MVDRRATVGTLFKTVVCAGLACGWVALMLAGCATCKSTDSPDVCRTKQREHSQPRV